MNKLDKILVAIFWICITLIVIGSIIGNQILTIASAVCLVAVIAFGAIIDNIKIR